MGRARDISKVFSTGTALATDSEVSGSYLTQSSASTVYQTKATAGLILLTPTSIANTSGTASIGANGTVSFSGASTVSLNGVFSTTYTNYRVVINVQSATSQVELKFRMRVSGTDYSGSDYYSQLVTGNSSSVTGERVAQDNAGTLAQITNNQSGIDAVFYRPFEAVRTMVTATSANSIDTIRNRIIGSVLADGVSYTGLTLVCGQNITGTISVYGYNK